jgi:hypothetical protein
VVDHLGLLEQHLEGRGGEVQPALGEARPVAQGGEVALLAPRVVVLGEGVDSRHGVSSVEEVGTQV